MSFNSKIQFIFTKLPPAVHTCASASQVSSVGEQQILSAVHSHSVPSTLDYSDPNSTKITFIKMINQQERFMNGKYKRTGQQIHPWDIWFHWSKFLELSRYIIKVHPKIIFDLTIDAVSFSLFLTSQMAPLASNNL